MLEDRMGPVLESSLSELPISLKDLVTSFLADTELPADISDLSSSIGAGPDEQFSF